MTPLPAPLADKTVAIIGAGKVGCAVATRLRAAGVPVVGVTTRHPETAEAAAQLTGAPASTDNAAVAALADIVLITVNDDQIATVCRGLADAGALRSGQLVAHMSGALQLAVLQPAADAGATVGCAHPLQSFATHEQAARDLGDCSFGVTAGPGAEATLEALVAVLGGRAESIADESKTLYHAAAVMASNYLVAVEDAAVRMLVQAGFDEAGAQAALGPLVRVTAANVVSLGTTAALTGPIARGDIETVRGHLGALDAEQRTLYCALGRQALEIARRRATVPAETLARLDELLGADESANEPRRTP